MTQENIISKFVPTNFILLFVLFEFQILQQFFRMFTTTARHRSFFVETLKDKDVTEVPGVTQMSGQKLKKLGYQKVSTANLYTTFQLVKQYSCWNLSPNMFSLLVYIQAETLLGQFLVLLKNEELFVTWFIMQTGGSKQSATVVYRSLLTYCDTNL